MTGLFHQAINLRYHLWHNRDFSAEVAEIRALPADSDRVDESGTPVQWVPGFPSGPLMYFDVSRPVREQLDWLAQQNPDYLVTYPTNLRALLECSEKTGQRPETLVGVMTYGELPEPAVRAACERVWNVTASDSYSAQEIGIIAIQCPENPHYHVQAENILVEVLDEDGKPCAPGEVGRLVMSDLRNFATPLIRYGIGDYAEVGEPCSCGRGLPVLNRIVGRTRNMLTLPTGDKIWPSFPEDRMMQIAPIRQFQIIQHDLQRIEARLVAARTLTDDEVGRLRSFLVDCLRHDFRLDLVFVDEIARLPGGKYEDFVSRVGS